MASARTLLCWEDAQHHRVKILDVVSLIRRAQAANAPGEQVSGKGYRAKIGRETMDRRLIRDLDVLTLQLFVAICEEGTLTRAARREAIAPSAVSKRLAELEAALNAELFHRQANGMTLTSAGETMLRYSRNMLQNIESIGAELKEYARGIRGFVRVRANMGSIVQFLPDDLSSFLTAHPDIRVDLVERPSRTVVDEIERGGADIGICSSIIDSAQLQHVLYRRFRLTLVVREDHPLAQRQEVSIRETLSYEHIGLQEHSAVFQLLSAYAEHLGVHLKLKLHVSGFDALLRMVQVGLGIGIMPDAAFAPIGHPMGLKAVHLTDGWAERQINIVHRGEQTLSAAGKLLLSHLTAANWPRNSRTISPVEALALDIGLPDWRRVAQESFSE
jgi:DNA-binding transcriptional LysR family regulator